MPFPRKAWERGLLFVDLGDLMSRCTRFSLAVLALLLLAPPAPAQGTKADYDRAAQLPQLFRGKVFKAAIDPHWFAGNKRFWYRNDLTGGASAYVLVDAVKGKQEPAFDHDKLAAALTKSIGKEVKANRLPITSVVFTEDGDEVRFLAADKSWQFNRNTHELKEVPKVKVLEDKRVLDEEESAALVQEDRGARSPDGKWVVAFKENNVLLTNRDKGDVTTLTKDGKSGDGFGGRVLWSPDSKYFVVFRTKDVEHRKVTLVESSPRDQVQPKVRT